MRRKNSYYLNITDTYVKMISAKDFKELSRKWDVIRVIEDIINLNGCYEHVNITIYGVENIECGRIVSHY